MCNLAEDPASANIVGKLESRLMAGLAATGDPRAAGAGDAFDHYPGLPDKKPKP
jgi:hypothetical protein